MASDKYDLERVNSMDFDEFQLVFGNVVENCPFCAGAVWDRRPFADADAMHGEFCDFLDQLAPMGRAGILRAFPNLAVGLAGLEGLTKESVGEQRQAGLLSLTKEEQQEMTSLNRAYRKQFGFPFVICARQNDKRAILKELQMAARNSKEREEERALGEAKKIARLRLNDLLMDTGDSTPNSQL